MNPRKIIYPSYWDEGVSAITSKDPILAKIIQNFKEIRLYSHGNFFLTLVRAIISQQISNSAAKKISQRVLFLVSLENMLLNKEFSVNISASCFLKSKNKFKYFGISEKKIYYLTEISKNIKKNPIYWNNLKNLTDDEIIKALCLHKGIGLWTAQMYLIFHLMRPNVFPNRDLGIINTIKVAYDLSNVTEVNALIPELTQMWHPWNTIAAWYLWCYSDSYPTVY
jgi:DNA-3-methyladenine glycosylase II